MSATNHTTNYELPVFIGTDKPAWLVDWNGAMTAIDTAIHQVEGKADQAGTDIGGIESDISTINGTITSINSAVSQLRTDTNANTGNINTINSLIGNGTPTTTDHTIIGAINEINAKVYDFELEQKTSSTSTPVSGASINSALTDMHVLLNSNGSVGKVYGGFYLNLSNATTSAGDIIFELTVPDLVLSDTFEVAGYSATAGPSGEFYTGFISLVFSNGKIRFKYANPILNTYTRIYASFPPCLLFLKDMGD